MRVCIDARLRTGSAGGVEQFVIGLAHGLSQLEPSGDEYLFLASPADSAWIEPHLGGGCRILHAREKLPPAPRWKEWARTLAPAAASGYRRLRAAWRKPASERFCGEIEAAGVDVMHFTLQSAFRTAVPSIYHPHDLQHRHLPRYFDRATRESRDREYRSCCERARYVAVASEWVRRDVIAAYGIDAAKVKVVPLAPPLAAYAGDPGEAVRELRARRNLPPEFLLYPAQTWPHKNHLGLIDALALLKRSGEAPPVVCCGRKNDFYPAIARRAAEQGVAGLLTFTGFVTPAEIQALYRLSTGVVVPTRFEAASFPVWEAFLAGRAVACSNVTSLPEQAGDAALVFDPASPEQIAAAIGRLWRDPALRATLVKRGAGRVRRLSWAATARSFRDLYRSCLPSSGGRAERL